MVGGGCGRCVVEGDQEEVIRIGGGVDMRKERKLVVEEIVRASEEYGFFKVVNHGVSPHIISNMEEAAFSFFSQPFPSKTAFPTYGSNNIGFSGDLGHLEYLILHPTHYSSLFHYPSNFRSSVNEYIKAVREVACEILEMMAEGVGVPNTWAFSALLRDHDSDSLLRLNHYPPLLPSHSSPSNSYNLGFGEHSDPQIITILRSNDVHGLQISLPDKGLWLPVSPDPSAFFVNVGDVLQFQCSNYCGFHRSVLNQSVQCFDWNLKVMTNGRFVSVRHRAVTNSHKSRMSMAYFGGPPLNACIVAPPEMVTPERPSLYRPFTWAEYKQAAYSLRLGDNRIHHFRSST
ncbi:gibberellin 2-beta-dioxygenase 2 [Senna tora]|uniref:Gibberellin 2-beta-dioxygenase 2 n=1 Tax=Senna tora TaxID=362788 RepID=A0A834X441_9FABA|nr:gibberellin 2-beta-dioxygenase 2 [Senna tora]